jgi:hypothetical protein
MMTTRLFSSLPLGVAAAAALLVAGCGSKSETEVASGTVTDPDTGEKTDYKITSSADGEEGNISNSTEDGEMRFGGGAANAKLPAGIAPFPGAKMTGGFAASGKDGDGGMASFEAKAQAADVIAHFRKQAEGAGMKVTTEVKAGDTLMLGAEKEGADKTGIQVTATQAGDIVNGTVTYSTGG